jgi:hypothetical protein
MEHEAYRWRELAKTSQRSCAGTTRVQDCCARGLGLCYKLEQFLEVEVIADDMKTAIIIQDRP